MNFLKGLVKKYNSVSLIIRIACGLILGTILGLAAPQLTFIGVFGNLFVGALKAVAPVLVFVLVVSALAQGMNKFDSRFGTVIALYVSSTLLASLVAVTGSFLFPQTLKLGESAQADVIPTGIGEVLNNLLINMVANPLGSIIEGKYIGILFWATILGLALKGIANDTTKSMLSNIADGVSQTVRWIINLAPFGIMGLVFTNVSTNGLSIFTDYGKLLLLLVGCMLTVALVVDPLVAWIALRRNPYPLVFRCLRESGVTAFFTRSSAANIPVNMELCEKLGLDRDMYSVSIPLGATINMDGAAVTIAVMTLAAAHTMGIAVDIPSALILSIIATLGACGASGVAGGSLLLIPMACSLFGISQDIAMQVVGVGFIIGVVQDSVETALNSSGDVMFAAVAEYRQWIKEGKELPTFLGGKREVDI
ncbi:MAG: serine/threonine transporter SstT [Lachnospiraceae bacterium]|nr:serine/threonine transporter SstT [Lachnospiraceae bacterium]